MNLKDENIVILGAGISGISVAYHLSKENIKSVIYEKNENYGGLCDNFDLNGFKFDKFVHLSFSNENYVKELFETSTEYNTHNPESINYYKGDWIRHPVQNNLYNLELEEKINIIKSFLDKKEYKTIDNYEDWLKAQYGDYFSENFPMRYNRKYWTVEANQLETKWVSGRMYVPNIDEILRGAMSSETPNVYYAKEMRYPIVGGYKAFLDTMVKDINIICDKEVVEIDIEEKKIYFSDNAIVSYDKLVSTIPLPELCRVIKNIPKEVENAGGNLDYTSGVIVSLGFNKPKIPPALWFYIYDEDIYPARVYSPSMKSSNNAPKGCSSLQAEIYFSKYKVLNESLEEIMGKTIDQMIKMKLFEREDIVVKDVRYEKYANVMFTKDIYKNRKIIHDYLDRQGVMYAGRFGEWDYLWSDQSLLSGKKLISNIVKKEAF